MTGRKKAAPPPVQPADGVSVEGHSLRQWSDAISTEAPVPGAGAAAAISASLAASLVAMCARITLGHRGYEDLEETFREMAAEGDALREDLVLLAEEDVMAYGAVAQAYAIPHGSDDEAVLRRINVNAALVGAAEVQIAVLRLAQATVSLARAAVEFGNRSVRADAAGAVVMAAAAARAAWVNARADLDGVHDPDSLPGDMSDEKIAGLLKSATRLLGDVETDTEDVRAIVRWP